MHSPFTQAGTRSQPGHCTDLPGDVQARPSHVQRELSGSTLAPSVEAKSKSLSHADLERCKAAVDQLAATLTAALAALQSGGEVRNDSTDITAALIEALEQAKHLPAGLRCEACKRRIAWRHVGQQGLCETGNACQVRGMASRMVSAEHTIRQIQSEHVSQRDGVRNVRLKPDRVADQGLLRRPDVASATRRKVTRLYSDDGLDKRRRTPSSNVLSSESQDAVASAEVELLVQMQRSRGTRSDLPRSQYRHFDQQTSSKPASENNAPDGSRTLRRKPPLRPGLQCSSISTPHRPPAAILHYDERPESDPRLAPLSAPRPMSISHEIEELANVGYVTVGRSAPSEETGLERMGSQGLAPQPIVNTYNDTLSGTNDRVPYPPAPQSLAAELLEQTEAEYLSVPEDLPERSAAEKAAVVELDRLLNEMRTLGESPYYRIATRAASNATTEPKSDIRAQLAESMAAVGSLTPPMEPEDRPHPAGYELRSGSADRGTVYSAGSPALPQYVTGSRVPMRFAPLSHDTDSPVATDSVTALLRRWLVEDV
ncbi:hypothetical protein LTR95_000597 [Oleoguttula sp. CCFEE 5521]